MSSPAAKVVADLDSVNTGDFQNERERVQAIQSAQRLINRLQRPIERVKDLVINLPMIFVALRVCADIGIWEHFMGEEGSVKTFDELSSAAPNVENNLLRRLLRILVGANMIGEAGVDTYTSTAFSRSMGDESANVSNWVYTGAHMHWPAALNLPNFLAKTGYKEPMDKVHSNFADMDPDGLAFFPRLQKDPKLMAYFNGHMEGYTAGKMDWTDMFDVTALLEGSTLEDAPFLVDVGGNQGFDIARVLDKIPSLPPGSLIIQDLPEVVAVAKTNTVIKAQEHDFFAPQPIKGSRVYYMHAILHDWPDSDCVKVLKNTADAMKPGYSKVLVHDIAVDDVGSSLDQSTMDATMMSLLSARERTRKQWTELLAQAGLTVVNFWPDVRGLEAVIEAEVAK